MSKTKLRPLSGSTIQLVDGDRGVNYPNKKDFSDNGFCLFLDSSNLTKNGFDFSSKVFISKNKDEAMGNGKLKRGDLVMNTRGTIGNMGVYKENVPYENIRINSGMLIIRGGADYDNGFLYGFFRSNLFYKQVENIMSGSVQSQLPIWIFNFIQVPELNIPAQKKISAVLSALDSKIELNNKINTKLEQMAKTLYDYWFVQFDFPDQNGKPYKTSGGKMVWSKELKRDIPEGWEVKKINSKIKIGSGYPFKTEDYNDNGKYKIITIKSVQEGYLDTNKADKIDFIPDNFPDFCKLDKGDVLMSLTGNVGRMCFVNQENLLLNQRVGKLLANRNFIQYGYLYFQRPENQKRLEKIANGSSQSNLSPVDAVKDYFAVPKDEILNAFSTTINLVFNKLLKIQEENQKLAELRDWLLPMLMNGQVAVK